LVGKQVAFDGEYDGTGLAKGDRYPCPTTRWPNKRYTIAFVMTTDETFEIFRRCPGTTTIRAVD